MAKETRLNKFKVRSDFNQVGSDQATVVLWFNLANAPAGLWDVIQSDGADLLVYSQDEATRFETFPVFVDKASRRGLLAAKGINLDSSAHTYYTIFCNDATATLPLATDTYGRNAVFDWKFEAVLDLINDASTIADLTGNGYTGTGSGLSVVNRGWFGKSLFNPSSSNQEGISIANSGSGSAFNGMAQAGFSWVEVKEGTAVQNESPWGYDANNQMKLSSHDYQFRIAATNRANEDVIDGIFAHWGFNYHDANDESQLFRNGEAGTLNSSTTEAWYTGVGLLNWMRARASGGNWESFLGTQSIALLATSERSADEYAIEHAMMWDGGGNAGSGSGYVPGSGEIGGQFWEWSDMLENCQERCSTDFRNYAIQDHVPGWVNIFNESNVSDSIVTDATSPGGKALQITKTGSGRPLHIYQEADGENHGALALIETDYASAAPSLWINASGSEGDENGYLFELAYATNIVGLWELTGGSVTFKDNDSFTLNANTKYWVRLCRFTNGAIRARIWEHGTNEPTAWNVQTTDSTHTGGSCGVSELANGTTPGSFNTWVHHISVGKGDNFPQGCEILEEDWPDGEALYMTLTSDESVRILELDGDERHAVINVLGDGAIHDPQQAAWHRTKEKLYVTCSNSLARGAILRYDKFGLGEEVVRTALANTFGICFDYDNSLMYYTNRVGVTGDLYKNSDDGGSESIIVSNAINWPGHPAFNPDDGFVYVPFDFAVRSYDASGTLQVTYPTDTGDIAHGVAVDGTNVMVGYWNDSRVFYLPIGTTVGPWTVGDTINQIWQMDLTPARDVMYGAAFQADSIYKWDSLPPPATANRTLVASGTGYDQIHSVTYVNFAPPASGSGFIGSGSGSGVIPASGSGSGFIGSGSGAVPGSGSGVVPGSGSGVVPGSGSGVVPGSGSGFVADECYTTIARDTSFNRLLLWQERSGAVVDIMGWEALANATPADRSAYYKGSASTRLSGSNSMAMRVIKSELIRQLKKMEALGCDIRAAMFGFVRHDMWLVDSKLAMWDAWNPGGRLAGSQLVIQQARDSGAIMQLTNILEFAPWYNSVATVATPDVPGSGSGSGFASGSSGTWHLLDRKNTSFNGPTWQVEEGDSVDSLGSFTGIEAVMEFVFPAGTMVLDLIGNWAGTLTEINWNGGIIEETTKVYGQDGQVTLDEQVWKVRVSVTSADEMPRLTVNHAGQSQGVREGLCLDCSDPGAVASGVPPWVQEGGPIYFVDEDTDHFMIMSADFTVETDTGLDLTSLAIVDISRHQVNAYIYGLTTGGSVYRWRDDGSEEPELVFSTGLSDLDGIIVDTANDQIILGSHMVNFANRRWYVYGIAGGLIHDYENRLGTGSIDGPPSYAGNITSGNYAYWYVTPGLIRYDISDGSVDSMQSASGLEFRAGAIDSLTGQAFRVVGSAIYQYNPITINNPSDAFVVAGNAEVLNSAWMDFFQGDDGVNVYVMCGGGKISSWRVNAANVVRERSLANARTLTCRRLFAP